jgi:hypothetical protein
MKKLNLPYNSTNGSNTIDGLNFIESRGFALLSQINDSTSQRGLTSFPDGTISAEYFTNVGTSTTPWKYGLSSTRKNKKLLKSPKEFHHLLPLLHFYFLIFNC